MCLSYLGLKTTKKRQGLELPPQVSVWKASPLLLPGADLCQLLSYHVKRLGLWFYLKTVLGH